MKKKQTKKKKQVPFVGLNDLNSFNIVCVGKNVNVIKEDIENTEILH